MGAWTYGEAFSRNLGLISRDEQLLLKEARVAIAGVGGVGGVEAVTLARMGIERFTIADPDVFEVANFNRQYGATVSSLGKSKVATLADLLRDINPEVDLRVVDTYLTPKNIDFFLEGAQLVVDGIDAFEPGARRLVFREAAARGIHAVTAGPIGFGVCFVHFDPQAMKAEEFFGFHEGMTEEETLARFFLGIAPSALQQSYMDYFHIDVEGHRGPSAASACQLAAGVVGAYAVKVLLKRGPLYSAPYVHQFDPYLCRYVREQRTAAGNMLLQEVKTWIAARRIKELKQPPGFPIDMGWPQ